MPAKCVCHTLSDMTQPTILISGAGVAGPALAHWLAGNGYRVVVVEVAPGIRPGGQTVDLRGAGRAVVERMGLLDQMADRSMRQRGIAWVRGDGSRRAEMPVEAFDGNGVVSKLEILRGDLVDVLYQDTKDRVEYRFDTRIAALEQTDDAVHVDAHRRHDAPGGPGGRRRRTAFGGAPDGLRAGGAIRQAPWRLSRLVHRARHGRARRLVPDAPGARRPECVDAAVARSGNRQGGPGIPLGTPDLRPARSRSATKAAGRQVRRRRLARRRIDQCGSRKPTTSTSTPSPRCTWSRGRRVA